MKLPRNENGLVLITMAGLVLITMAGEVNTTYSGIVEDETDDWVRLRHVYAFGPFEVWSGVKAALRNETPYKLGFHTLHASVENFQKRHIAHAREVTEMPYAKVIDLYRDLLRRGPN